MENRTFKIKFDKKLGGIVGLTLSADPDKMNFVKKGRALGNVKGFKTQSVQNTATGAVFLAKNERATVKTEFRLNGELLEVSHVVKNEGEPVYFKDGEFAVEMPLNDRYESSEICMKGRCHAHIFAGEECSYILAERMGVSEHNLGVLLTKGKISSYSQEEVWHSNRGFFLLNSAAFTLLKGESHEISYVIFPHKGGEDFYKKAKAFKNFLRVFAPDGYTVELGKPLRFSVQASTAVSSAKCVVNDEEIPVQIDGDKMLVEYLSQTTGKKKMCFTVNRIESHATFNVVLPFEELIEKRIDFIVKKQQCLDENSPLYGAYLVYDNEEERQFFDSVRRDCNANRERFGMAILIAKYLQTHENAVWKESLDKFTAFMLRESVEEKTGEVFDGIGKNPAFLRLYNAPWVALYFNELYKLTKEARWLDLIAKVTAYYYSVGGAKFYPNGIRFFEFFDTLKEGGKIEECERLLKCFDEHIANIVKNGVIYPPHEVNFEQTIVTPAVTLLLDKYQLCGEEKYLREAEKHLKILKKFDGAQPDYHLQKIPVRFWDAYWFGKIRNYGDTFPHYWSVLSGYCFWLYGKLAGLSEGENYGKECIENCACLFTGEGRASCAYVYPKSINGAKGEYFDAFANDQDFALYFLLKIRK